MTATKVTRQTQTIFASAASNNGVFGSAANNTKVLSNDLPTLMGLAAWENGWLDAVLGTKNFPPLEEMQSLNYINTYQLTYILQEGIPEYDSGTIYFTNSVVKQPGTYRLYGSLTNDNQGNALTSGTNWQFLVDLGAAPVASSYLNSSVDSGTANNYILTPNPAPGAYAAGQIVVLNPLNANTAGTSQIYLNSLTEQLIEMPNGSTTLPAGVIQPGYGSILYYNGTNFVLLNPYYQFGTAAFLNVGSGANQIPQLDSSGRYPAADGSRITNIPPGFTTNNAASGSIVLGAVTIQWGSAGNAQDTVVNFGTPFSGAPYFVGVTSQASSFPNFTTGNEGAPSAYAQTATGFKWHFTAYASNVQYFAVGPT